MESKTAPPPYLIEAAARARAARKLNQLRRWAEEMRAAGWTVTEPRAQGEVASAAELEHWAAVLRCAGYWVVDPGTVHADDPAFE